MKKFYQCDAEGRICVTTKTGKIVNGKMVGDQFDFPDDFDFERQHFFKIINGKLVEDTEAVAAEKSEQIRNERDNLLKQCDFTILPDSPYTAEQRAEWAAYRQALRDIPEQLGFPFNVEFPKMPK